MAIPVRQIGWDAKTNVLWSISKQLDLLTRIWTNCCESLTTTTSTTECIYATIDASAPDSITITSNGVGDNPVTWYYRTVYIISDSSTRSLISGESSFTVGDSTSEIIVDGGLIPSWATGGLLSIMGTTSGDYTYTTSVGITSFPQEIFGYFVDPGYGDLYIYGSTLPVYQIGNGCGCRYETIMTIGEDQGSYGYSDGTVYMYYGELNPSMLDIKLLVYDGSSIGLMLISDNPCSEITLKINEVEYILFYLGDYETASLYVLEIDNNPFSAVGETCSIKICDDNCIPITTTTTSTIII